jgi:hypothetical protein
MRRCAGASRAAGPLRCSPEAAAALSSSQLARTVPHLHQSLAPASVPLPATHQRHPIHRRRMRPGDIFRDRQQKEQEAMERSDVGGASAAAPAPSAPAALAAARGLLPGPPPLPSAAAAMGTPTPARPAGIPGIGGSPARSGAHVSPSKGRHAAAAAAAPRPLGSGQSSAQRPAPCPRRRHPRHRRRGRGQDRSPQAGQPAGGAGPAQGRALTTGQGAQRALLSQAIQGCRWAALPALGRRSAVPPGAGRPEPAACWKGPLLPSSPAAPASLLLAAPAEGSFHAVPCRRAGLPEGRQAQAQHARHPAQAAEHALGPGAQEQQAASRAARAHAPRAALRGSARRSARADAPHHQRGGGGGGAGRGGGGGGPRAHAPGQPAARAAAAHALPLPAAPAARALAAAHAPRAGALLAAGRPPARPALRPRQVRGRAGKAGRGLAGQAARGAGAAGQGLRRAGAGVRGRLRRRGLRQAVAAAAAAGRGVGRGGVRAAVGGGAQAGPRAGQVTWPGRWAWPAIGCGSCSSRCGWGWGLDWIFGQAVSDAGASSFPQLVCVG